MVPTIMGADIVLDRKNNPYHDDKLFWPYHMRKAITIIRGQIPTPSLVEIDPTDGACNQACICCCFNGSPRRKKVSINVEMLLRFLQEVYNHGTYAYELVGGSEPTNHPRIGEIITGIVSLKKPNKERPHIGLVTNGVLLHRIFPVAKHLDFIRVSLDASDSVTYEKIHGVDSRHKLFCQGC